MRYVIADHLIELPAWVAGTPFGRALTPFEAPCTGDCPDDNNPAGADACSVARTGSGTENLSQAGNPDRADACSGLRAGAGTENAPQADSQCGNGAAFETDQKPFRDNSPVRIDPAGEAPVLILNCGKSVPPAGPGYRELDTFDFPDAEAVCRFGRDAEEHRFSMHLESGEVVTFVRTFGTAEVVSNITPAHNPSLLRFGLWMLCGLAVNSCGTVALHSSVIRTAEGAVLFLGESGTGKSTHTRLWREHIPGATLLNDDSPIVRVREGIPTVYGSPWSGKTPCYKAASGPIRGIVRLSQAPHNRIRRLPALAALGALLPSCPPAFAHDPQLQDHICSTLSALIAAVPVFHLECLPDAAAAELSCKTIFGR